MKKRLTVFGFILTMVMLLGFSMTVFASGDTDEDTLIGSKNMKCTFDGKKLDSDLGSIMELVNQMQPGDSVKFEIELINKYEKTTDFWMWNKVIKSFEKNSPANGGAYTYILTYTGPNGKTEDIFRSDTVGGEEISNNREGMREATSNLEDYFFLYSLKKGESGKVTLVVKLDGETQGNNYQNTLADIDFRFACEIQKEKQENNPKKNNPTPTRKIAKTGDDFNILPYAAALAGSGILLLLILVFTRRKKGGEDVNA